MFLSEGGTGTFDRTENASPESDRLQRYMQEQVSELNCTTQRELGEDSPCA